MKNMRVYIKTDKKGEFENVNFFNAYDGFQKLGWEIIKFNILPEEGLFRDEIVVGYITEVKQALRNLNIEPPTEIDYPEELNSYYGRKIWESDVDYISLHPELFPIFIKPKSGKQFDGRLVKKFSDLIGCGKKEYSPNIWCSEPINFITEYRCFVKYGRVIDIRKYKGDWRQIVDYKVIEASINDYTSKPNAFTIDFGITDDKRTLLVEVNDGYSCGAYGLASLDYAKFLSARWAQMTDTPDNCLF